MPMHSTNQRAFRDGDINEPFYRLYTLLVAIEIALKDRLPHFAHGHELAALVPQVIPLVPSGLQSQLTALDTSLRALICTFHGARVQVNPAVYPGIRYLRHVKDGFAGDSSDADIAQALSDCRQLVEELKLAGVTL